MIDLELRWALVLYSGVLGAMALGIWIYTELTVRRPQRYLGQQYLWRCSFCGFSYLDEEGEQISQCPRCGSYNDADDKHARSVPTKSRRVTAEEAPAEGPSTEPSRRNPSRRKRPHQRRRGPRKR